MNEAFEHAVHLVAYYAVLVLGAACLVGVAGVTLAWAIKRLLVALGLYRDFRAFSRSRRRR